MTRQTSVDAYYKIRDNGMLSNRRWQVYDVVYKCGPMTSAEAFKVLNKNNPIGNITQSRARFTELREMGVIEEVGTKKCTVTGMSTIVWRVTNNLPKALKKDKKSTYKELEKYNHIYKYKLKEAKKLIKACVDLSTGDLTVKTMQYEMQMWLNNNEWEL